MTLQKLLTVVELSSANVFIDDQLTYTVADFADFVANASPQLLSHQVEKLNVEFDHTDLYLKK